MPRDGDADADVAFEATIAPSAVINTKTPSGVTTPVVRSGVAPKIGERIGDRYQIRAFLGEGGMGAVYLAFDEKLGDQVALKVVRGASAAAEMLREEVRIAQKVTHVNVCRTYDLEEIDGDYVVKMEYVGGETLSTRMKREGRLSVAEAVRIGRAIAAALEAAHVQNIVHRDLKPGNVMLAKDRVVLMDFGLAKHVENKPEQVAGTPGYMSPEQLLGAPVDSRSDLYALGCLIYEMLSGEHVFNAKTREQLDRDHASTPPPNLRSRRPDAPRWLASAVERLLAKDPAERTAGARALAPQRQRVLWLALGGVAVVAAAVAIVLLRAATPQWEPTIEPVRWPYEDRDSPASLSSDGSRIAFSTNGKLYVMPTHGSGSATAVVDEVAGYARPRWSHDSNTILVARKGNLQRITLATQTGEDLGEEPQQFDDCGDHRLAIEFDMAGARLVLEPGHDVLYTSLSPAYSWPQDPHCDVATGKVLFVMGPSVASACVDDIWIVAHGQPAHAVTTTHDICGATFTPGARSVVYSAKRNGKINLYERMFDTGQEHAVTNGPGPDTEPDVSADGSTLAFANRPQSSVVTVFDGEKTRRLTVKVGVVDSMSATRDFKFLVAQRNDPYENGELIEVIDVAADREHVLGHGILAFPSFDGERVYFRPPDLEHGNELHMVPIKGGEEVVVAKFPGQITIGHGARDGVHVLIQHEDRRFEGFRLDDAGNPVSEHVGGLVMPAPEGGWRAVEMAMDQPRLDLVPPGNPLDKPIASVSVYSYYPQWIDDTHLGATVDGVMAVIDVTKVDHPEEALIGIANPPQDLGALPLAVVGGGNRWATLTSYGSAKHQVITNFAARPWK